MSGPRVALVHERLTEIAGSEHVVDQLAAQWPGAQLHVPIFRDSVLADGWSHRPATSWLNLWYRALGQRTYAPLLPLMPMAMRGLRLGDPDVVLISHHAFASQAVYATDAPAIAYVHSPARWAWDPALRAGEASGPAGAAALTALAALARRGEVDAAPKLAAVVANSTEVAVRIGRWWGRTAMVVHPPVDTDFFTPDRSIPREDFFLLAGRLVPYKRPDLAVIAAQRANVSLVVVGDGRSLEQCRRLAGPNTTFLGHVTRGQLRDLHRRCRAVVMPGLEDFGIVPVEAMACGGAVVARGAGGALDSVRAGVTGQLVDGTGDDELIDGFACAMRRFEPGDYDPGRIRMWAQTFSRRAFRARMQEVVDDVG